MLNLKCLWHLYPLPSCAIYWFFIIFCLVCFNCHIAVPSTSSLFPWPSQIHPTYSFSRSISYMNLIVILFLTSFVTSIFHLQCKVWHLARHVRTFVCFQVLPPPSLTTLYAHQPPHTFVPLRYATLYLTSMPSHVIPSLPNALLLLVTFDSCWSVKTHRKYGWSPFQISPELISWAIIPDIHFYYCTSWSPVIAYSHVCFLH